MAQLIMDYPASGRFGTSLILWRRVPLRSPRYRTSVCRSSLTKDTLARVGRSAMDA